jgi:hypothetical protein
VVHFVMLQHRNAREEKTFYFSINGSVMDVEEILVMSIMMIDDDK